MKVLHINSNYLTTALHQNMIEHLDRAAVENTVIATTYNAENCMIKLNENVIPAQCFKKNDRYFFRHKQKKIIGFINDKVSVGDYDLIHACTLFTDGNSAYELSKQHGIPYVVAVRSTDLNHFFKYRINLRKLGIEILEHAAAVIFLSGAYKEALLSQYIPAGKKEAILQKSYIIPNGIDDFWLENRNDEKRMQLRESLNRLEDKRLNVVFAGVICERKNPIVTQEALQLLRQKGWQIQYTVAGKIADKRLYEKMCEYPGTVYVGQQPKEKLLEYYRANDLFVMPSHKETFGLVYSEAISQGLPVLYTKGQGFDGQFPDGVVGYPISDTNPQEIADKVELVIKNYQEIVTNCLQYTERFRWDDICGQYKKIYVMITSK